MICDNDYNDSKCESNAWDDGHMQDYLLFLKLCKLEIETSHLEPRYKDALLREVARNVAAVLLSRPHMVDERCVAEIERTYVMLQKFCCRSSCKI